MTLECLVKCLRELCSDLGKVGGVRVVVVKCRKYYYKKGLKKQLVGLFFCGWFVYVFKVAIAAFAIYLWHFLQSYKASGHVLGLLYPAKTQFALQPTHTLPKNQV